MKVFNFIVRMTISKTKMFLVMNRSLLLLVIALMVKMIKITVITELLWF